MTRLTASVALLTVLAAGAWAAFRPAQGMPQPTPEHADLLKGVGMWEGTLTMFVPGASAEPTPCQETIVGVGDFWTSSTFTCDFMGMPFVGNGVLGFDTERKLFVGTWIDSMTTRLVVMEGKMDPAKKALVMSYEAPSPMDGKMTRHRIETVHESADAYTSTFFMGEGEGQKHMVIAMKRKK
jgi:hypothetical protein